MKLKKYNQFLKLNEGTDPAEFEEFDNPADLKSEITDELEEDDMDFDDDDDDQVEDENEEIEGEEEGGEYIGNEAMRKLSAKLGAKVINNQIEHEGKKVNFFSEDNRFHIGRVKIPATGTVDKSNVDKAVEEVLEFLGTDTPTIDTRIKRSN